jgi:hypothetical protein
MDYPFRCWLFGSGPYPVEGINAADDFVFDYSGKQDLFLPVMAETIARAAEFGLTALQLAEVDPHRLVTYTDFPKLSQLAKDANQAYRENWHNLLSTFAKECRKQQIKPYWFHFEISHYEEIGVLYPEALDPNRSLMWDIMASRVRGMFELIPDMAGLELYLDEGPAGNVSHLGQWEMPAGEIVARVISTVMNVCRDYNKELIICTFTGEMYRLLDIRDGLKLIPPTKGLYVNNWVVPGDWGEYLAHNPLIGDVGGHPEIITFDFGAENWGQCQTPFCYPDYIADRWRDALKRSNNVVGYNGWAMWNWNRNIAKTSPCILNCADEINAYSLTKLIEEPEISVDTIWNDWASRCSNDPETIDTIISALKQTREIGEKAWMLKGFWFMEWPKSHLPELYYLLHSPYDASSAEWDESLQPIEDAIFFPDGNFVAEIIKDRDQAVELAEQTHSEIISVSGKLTSPWDKTLEETAERLAIFTRISRIYTELFLLWKMWWMRQGGTQEQIEECVASLNTLADEIEKQYGSDIWPGNPGRARLFAKEMQLALEYGQGPDVKWCGILNGALGKRITHSILTELARMVEAKAAGTLACADEQNSLNEIKRLTDQLQWLV